MVAGQAMAPGQAVLLHVGEDIRLNTDIATILLLGMVEGDARGLQHTLCPVTHTLYARVSVFIL